jgi:hypothetical protein
LPTAPAASILQDVHPGLLAQQRIAVLVDLNAVQMAARDRAPRGDDDRRGPRLNFRAFTQTVARGRQIGRLIGYLSERAGGGRDLLEQQQQILACGFEVRNIDNLSGQRDQDRGRTIAVSMSMDAAVMAERYDAVVLVTGDPVLAVAARSLSARAVRVEVIATRDDQVLREAAGHYAEISPEVLSQ